MTLRVVPLTIRAANAFVRAHHRHHRPRRGLDLFAVGAAVDDQVVGAAIVSRPNARMACDGWTVEVTRVATDGTRNACSLLYGACWRAARALGWLRCITYTLPEEGGASLRGAGWRVIGEAGGGTWSRADRPRVDDHPTQVKMRWEIAA